VHKVFANLPAEKAASFERDLTSVEQHQRAARPP
jgi:hypothetical protein